MNKACGKRGIAQADAVNCGNGFRCLGGTLSQTPTKNQAGEYCDAGKYCSVLTGLMADCLTGYYQPNKGQGTCIGCHAGMLCTDAGYPANLALRPVVCPAGKYCLAQTSSSNNGSLNCPAGYYSAMVGLGAISECTQCPPGKYCAGGLGQPSGNCDAGYFCPKGQSTKTFAADYKFGGTAGGKCPKGHYCTAGTLAPIPCPVGTYNDDTGKSKSTDCVNCPGGYYCDEVGLTNAIIKSRNKVCDAGYYCTGKATTPTPIDGTTGNICTKGHYCPEGATAVTKCAAGTYNHITG